MGEEQEQPVRRRRGRPRASRPDLIEAVAVKLFEEKGFEQTSIEDITAAAGISRSTLFRYITSKGNLLWLHRAEYEAAFDRSLAEAPADAPVTEVLVETMVTTHSVELHRVEMLKAKWRLVTHSEGPAETSIALQLQWAEQLSRFVAERLPQAEPSLLNGIGLAFVSVSFGITGYWARTEEPADALPEMIREALWPLAHGYRAMLEPGAR